MRHLKNSPSAKKVVAVDFDGTLVKNKYPFIENPNEKLLRFIREHRSEYIWVLWTCRTGSQLEKAIGWLREQGIEFDYVNANTVQSIDEYGDSRKVNADYYIDDKAIGEDEFYGRFNQ